MNKERFNFFLYSAVILTTGFCSLGYQVVWQRYISVLIGSEARSSTIIVAVFLTGLSIGYYYFGKLSEKITSRHKLLKTYGVVELITAAYVILFPSFFEYLLNHDVSMSHQMIVHILLVSLLILFPTILMGATIPVMTAVLPDKNTDVNQIHTKIYGINTLGAFLGVLITGFFILPNLGYEMSLLVLGTVNFLVSLIYIWNNLDGHIYEKEQMTNVENKYSHKALYGFAFTAGLTCITFEILWFRILSLSIGSSFIVFPMVLSIFVLAIGLGSLTLKKICTRSFKKNLLYMLILNLILFVTAPYLGILFSNIRVSLTSYSFTYYVFYSIVYVTLALFLAPPIFYLGRALPFVFSMLDKNKSDYGFKCGILYFLNTVGTFFGAVLFGYFLLHYFNIPEVYKINLFFLIAFGFYFFYRDKLYKTAAVLVVTGITVWALPFSSKGFSPSLFRIKQPQSSHFKNIFTVKLNENSKTIFYDDGPNTTVAVIEGTQKEKIDKSFLVNGKSDGSTIGDYGTTTGLALYPYLFTQGEELNTAVVGLGTGITAGLMGKFQRVKTVDVIEISNAAIKSIDSLKEANFDLKNNKKIEIHNDDAFKYFRRVNKKYDFIVSEPSNPWVMGVENTYTKYFYDLINRNLDKDGVFVQWAHTYSMNNQILATILANLKSTFEVVELYELPPSDIAIIATNRSSPLEIDTSKSEKVVQEIIESLSLTETRDLDLLKKLNNKQVSAITETESSYMHEIFHPTLSFHALKSFFLGESADLDTILNPSLSRILLSGSDYEQKSFGIDKLRALDCKKENKKVTLRYDCMALYKYKKALEAWESDEVEKRLKAYSYLRDNRFISRDEGFLDEVYEKLISDKTNYPKEQAGIGLTLVSQLNREGLFKKSKKLFNQLKEKSILKKESISMIEEDFEKIEKSYKKIGLDFVL